MYVSMNINSIIYNFIIILLIIQWSHKLRISYYNKQCIYLYTIIIFTVYYLFFPHLDPSLSVGIGTLSMT